MPGLDEHAGHERRDVARRGRVRAGGSQKWSGRSPALRPKPTSARREAHAPSGPAAGEPLPAPRSRTTRPSLPRQREEREQRERRRRARRRGRGTRRAARPRRSCSVSTSRKPADAPSPPSRRGTRMAFAASDDERHARPVARPKASWSRTACAPRRGLRPVAEPVDAPSAGTPSTGSEEDRRERVEAQRERRARHAPRERDARAGAPASVAAAAASPSAAPAHSTAQAEPAARARAGAAAATPGRPLAAASATASGGEQDRHASTSAQPERAPRARGP